VAKPHFLEIDFAAAAMLRLIGLGLKRQGIAWPAPGPAAARGAHGPLGDKRRLLDALLQQHGAEALLRIGEGVHDASDEPALVALTLARDPADLIARWQRLERFIHSRHRVRIEAAGEGRLQLRHVSLVAGQPPTLAEDLLVFGLLVALVEHLGTAEVSAQTADAPWARRERGRWQVHAAPGGAACWWLRWQARLPAPPLPSAVHTDWVGTARRLLQHDPARGWTLHALASDMHCSARSLQRHLAAHGSGFGLLLRQVRLARSARLLAESPQSPAQIGYLCGFSDQAHFTREFKHHSALTPARFREQFAVAR
jgi:AraC-like DNA-binding protein